MTENILNDNSSVSEELLSFREQGFTEYQLIELKKGLESGVDVKLYANKNYLAVQMRQIRYGLEDGLDVSLYNDEKYDWFQMEEIRRGIKSGVDISIFSKETYSYEVMREIRKALEDNIHIEKFAFIGADKLRELHLAILDKQDIMPYIKEGYVSEQLEEIRYAMKQGFEIDPFLDKAYRGAALREFNEGFKKGLDVELYANPNYSWQQMREIRIGLEKRLDVAIYNKELYDWQQMHEIRLGLEDRLDIDGYKSMMYSAADMHRMRLKLKEAQDKYEKFIEQSQLEGDEEEKFIEDLNHTFATDSVKAFIEQEGMKAYIFVGEDAIPPTYDELCNKLKNARIVKGIDTQTLKEVAEGKYRNKLVIVARGRLPIKGKDGYYESFIGDDENFGIKRMIGGSYDYRDAYIFKKVRLNQTLLVYHSAEKGVDGYTVDGKELKALPGEEKESVKGRGFTIREDKKTYIANGNGCAKYRGNKLVVVPLLELDEVSNITGEIDFYGSIHIKGNVVGNDLGNVKIKALEDIVVEGFVENAIIESEGHILIKNGSNGNGFAQITAEKWVVGKFFENGTIKAENIISNCFFRCNLYANNAIEASGSGGGNGTISGGSAYAGMSIEASYIGNKSGVETNIAVGYNKSEDDNNFVEQLKEAQSQLSILRNAKEDYQEKYPPEVRNTMDMYLKIENAIYTKEKDVENIMKEIELQAEIREKLKKAYIKAAILLYEGTNVTINNVVFKPDTSEGIMLKNQLGYIQTYNVGGEYI